MFALDGSYVAFNLGGEAKEPRTSIPLAVNMGTLIGGILYALLAFIATTAVDFRQLIPLITARPLPLGEFARVTAAVASIVSLPVIFRFSLAFTTLITLVPGFLFSMLLPVSVLFIQKKCPNLYRQSLLPLPRAGLFILVTASLGISLFLSWNGLLMIGVRNLIYFAGFLGLGTVYYFAMVARMKKEGRNYRDILTAPCPGFSRSDPEDSTMIPRLGIELKVYQASLLLQIQPS
jgi:hypothetical protein